MSMIVCDICGTAYPDTSKQCPICGCVRPADVKNAAKASSNSANSSGYTYVKGGRYSKSNVKKRAKTQVTTTGVRPVVSANAVRGDTKTSGGTRQAAGKSKNNIGLVITAVVLLLAILVVVGYVAVRFFAPISDMGNSNLDNTATGDTNDTGGPAPVVPCVTLELDTTAMLFDTIDTARMLYVTAEPQNTTDVITFSSSDESVATVNEDGRVMAVGNGEAIITVTCGDITAQCNVKCEIPEETTEATEETTEATEETTEPTVTEEDLRLNRKDITFSYKGESWMLYDGRIAKNLITWTSDDESVVTITDGNAVAVGYGVTEVHAEYEGMKVSCIIRCSFSGSGSSSSGVSGSGGGISEDG